MTSARPDAATLQIDAGPMATPANPQQWSAPEGVHLLHTVSIETLAAQGGLNYLRARIVLPEFAKANVRTEGKPRVCRSDVAARWRGWPGAQADDRSLRDRRSRNRDPRLGMRASQIGVDRDSGSGTEVRRTRRIEDAGLAISRGDRADPPAHQRGQAVPVVGRAVRFNGRLQRARSDPRDARSLAGGDERAGVRSRAASVAHLRRLEPHERDWSLVSQAIAWRTRKKPSRCSMVRWRRLSSCPSRQPVARSP